MMERMSPLDAGFLDLEAGDRHASLAIASVAVFEGPAPTYDEFLAAIAGRLPLVPRYRQKARRLPLDLGRPVGWTTRASTSATTSGRPPCPPPAATRSCGI